MTAHPASRAEEAHAAADELLRALASVGVMVSVCEPERYGVGGGYSGRVRVILTADAARGHAQRCRRMAATEALEA